MRAIATLLVGEALLLTGLWFGIDWTVATGAAGAQLVGLSLLRDWSPKPREVER